MCSRQKKYAGEHTEGKEILEVIITRQN